jgi:hypothetical protein
MEIEITIYDAAGNVTRHHKGMADTATDDEIAEMVSMIESGTPAYLAAILAKQKQS